MLTWAAAETFTTCAAAQQDANMKVGIYNGIVDECYRHDVIPKMQEYLWELRTKVEAYTNCKWYDCTT